MIWGYPYSWKHPYSSKTLPTSMRMRCNHCTSMPGGEALYLQPLSGLFQAQPKPFFNRLWPGYPSNVSKKKPGKAVKTQRNANSRQGCRFVPYTSSETIRHRWYQKGSKYCCFPGFGGLIHGQIYKPTSKSFPKWPSPPAERLGWKVFPSKWCTSCGKPDGLKGFVFFQNSASLQ